MGAPYFCWPHKPLINAAIGSSYETAYKRFRANHKDRNNIMIHLVMLVVQLVMNFALLREVDNMVEVNRGIPLVNMSTLTAALWILSLVLMPAPLMVRLSCVVTIWLGREVSGTYLPDWVDLVNYSIPVEVVAIYCCSDEIKASFRGFSLHPVLHLILRVLAQIYIVEPYFRSQLISHRMEANIAFFAFMFLFSRRRFTGKDRPPPRGEFAAIAFGWALALATDQPWIIFYTFGHMLSSMQGSHIWRQDKHTPPAAMDGHAGEWAQTTFFPLLVLNVVHDEL